MLSNQPHDNCKEILSNNLSATTTTEKKHIFHLNRTSEDFLLNNDVTSISSKIKSTSPYKCVSALIEWFQSDKFSALSGSILPSFNNMECQNAIENPRYIDELRLARADMQEKIPDEELVCIDEILYNKLEKNKGTKIEKSIKPFADQSIKSIMGEAKNLLMTGYIKTVKLNMVETQNCIKITMDYLTNPILKKVLIQGSQFLSDKEIENLFRTQLNQIFNDRNFEKTINRLNKWYLSRGYYGRVSDVKYDLEISGSVTINFSETIVNKIDIKYYQFNNKLETMIPTEGKTRQLAILRHINSKSGQILSKKYESNDVESICCDGIYEKVNFEHSEPKFTDTSIDLTDIEIGITEKKSRRLKTRLFNIHGHRGYGMDLSYIEKNIHGLNQSVTLSLEANPETLKYKLNYSDPWIKTNTKRIKQNFLISNTINYSNDNLEQNFIRKSSISEESTNINLTHNDCDSGSLEWSYLINNHWKINWGIALENSKHVKRKDNSEITRKSRKWNPKILSSLQYKKLKSDDYFSMHIDKMVPFSSTTLTRSNFTKVTGAEYNWSQKIIEGSYSLYSNIEGIITTEKTVNPNFNFKPKLRVIGHDKGSIDLDRLSHTFSSEFEFKFAKHTSGILFSDFGSDCRKSGWGLGSGIKFLTPLGNFRLNYCINDMHICSWHTLIE